MRVFFVSNDTKITKIIVTKNNNYTLTSNKLLILFVSSHFFHRVLPYGCLVLRPLFREFSLQLELLTELPLLPCNNFFTYHNHHLPRVSVSTWMGIAASTAAAVSCEVVVVVVVAVVVAANAAAARTAVVVNWPDLLLEVLSVAHHQPIWR